MSHDTYDKLGFHFAISWLSANRRTGCTHWVATTWKPRWQMCLEANGDLSELTDRDDSWSGLKPIKDRNLGRLTNWCYFAFAWRLSGLNLIALRASSCLHQFEKPSQLIKCSWRSSSNMCNFTRISRLHMTKFFSLKSVWSLDVF